ncbi:hypothetical protein [Dyella acidiphila]|uniref:Uncharacterized protein n=1 Tax=Dyella acidiphila TaxID=2775866 RepID=A0ABR9G9I5_9GAMM|nr:hypothetical protein [Dyella acidiphila]MBE1160686.1 hypothetical protein [Dyella acidiphila]
MQRYRAFATIDVRHDYFADGSARDLVFRPHADTSAFLHRFAMLVHADGRSLGISVADSQLPGIWSERNEEGQPRSLCFDLYSGDADCVYYTETVAVQPPTQQDGIQPAPLLPVAASPRAPLATVALPLSGGGDDFAAWVEALGTAYRLHLQSRSTIWKYLLVGDWRGRALSIVDQRGEVSFTTPAQQVLPNGQSALVVHSTSPIAMRERPPQRFQLRDVTDTPGRVLISRLPGAAPQRLWRETVRGVSTAVSEIFVHS